MWRLVLHGGGEGGAIVIPSAVAHSPRCLMRQPGYPAMCWTRGFASPPHDGFAGSLRSWRIHRSNIGVCTWEMVRFCDRVSGLIFEGVRGAREGG